MKKQAADEDVGMLFCVPLDAGGGGAPPSPPPPPPRTFKHKRFARKEYPCLCPAKAVGSLYCKAPAIIHDATLSNKANEASTMDNYGAGQYVNKNNASVKKKPSKNKSSLLTETTAASSNPNLRKLLPQPRTPTITLGWRKKHLPDGVAHSIKAAADTTATTTTPTTVNPPPNTATKPTRTASSSNAAVTTTTAVDNISIMRQRVHRYTGLPRSQASLAREAKLMQQARTNGLGNETIVPSAAAWHEDVNTKPDSQIWPTTEATTTAATTTTGAAKSSDKGTALTPTMGEDDESEDIVGDGNQKKKATLSRADNRRECFTFIAIALVVPLIVAVICSYNSIRQLLVSEQDEDDTDEEKQDNNRSSGSDRNNSYQRRLIVWKAIFQLFLALFNFACFYFPLHKMSAFSTLNEQSRLLSLGNTFAAGVFLSMAFAHLLPEAIHSFHEDHDTTTEEDNMEEEGEGEDAHADSLPLLLVLAGYLAIFFVEKVAFDAHSILHEDCCGQVHDIQVPYGAAIATSATANDDVIIGLQNEADQEAEPINKSAIILLAALGVHSLSEGMALGLASSFSDAAVLSVSIALHQPAESMALLAAFIRRGFSKPDITRYLSGYATVGPLGFVIGVLVGSWAPPGAAGAMVAIVAGTFVYAGATEIIPEEWEYPSDRWAKFATLSFGLVLVLAVTQIESLLGGHH